MNKAEHFFLTFAVAFLAVVFGFSIIIMSNFFFTGVVYTVAYHKFLIGVSAAALIYTLGYHLAYGFKK